jgi:hypothetical protein
MNLEKWLDALLDECAKPMPPDYMTFYSRVLQTLGSGVSPKTFCEVFAARVKRFDGLMRKYARRGEQGHDLSPSELEEFRITFHKYKLLNGCAEKLPEEIRQQIAELAGCRVMGT